MPQIDPALTILALLLFALCWERVREAIIDKLPLPPLMKLPLDTILNPVAWLLSPTFPLRALGLLPPLKVPERSPQAIEADRSAIAALVEKYVPNVGDGMVWSDTSSFDREKGLLGSSVRVLRHTTLARVASNKAVMIDVYKGVDSLVGRRVVNLPDGLTINVYYDTVEEINFCDADTYGGRVYPENMVLLELSVMGDNPRCKIKDCVYCARLREALKVQDGAA